MATKGRCAYLIFTPDGVGDGTYVPCGAPTLFIVVPGPQGKQERLYETYCPAHKELIEVIKRDDLPTGQKESE
jgi:hypothetical protein